jgi:hypothetical protein
METIIREVLIDYMEEDGFFTKYQHGFRKGSSCATQLIEVMEQWTEDLDKKKSIDVIWGRSYNPTVRRHLCGSLLSSIDLLNIFATGVVMLSIVSLSNFGCIESDPCDFVSFFFYSIKLQTNQSNINTM